MAIKDLLPVLSLVVAILAVFVGPLLTWKLTGRQIEESRLALEKQLEAARKSANKQIIAPMRQAWINNLRKKVVQLMGLVSASDPNDQTLAHASSVFKLKLEILLMLNRTKPHHQALEKAINKMLHALGKEFQRKDFNDACDALEAAAATLFSAEWKRIKTEDAN